MGQDVVMWVFGKIDRIKVLTGLARTAAEDKAGLDWNVVMDHYEAEEAIVDAAQDGKHLLLLKKDSSYPLDQVTDFCRANGLSYQKSVGPKDEDGYDFREEWMPGMAEARIVALGDDDKPAIPLEKAKEAANQGIEAVQSLIQSYETVFPNKGDMKLVVSEDVIAVWQAENEIEVTPKPSAGMRP